MKLIDPPGVYAILAALAPMAQTYLGVGVQEGECVRHVVTMNPLIDVTLCDTWGAEHGGTSRGSHVHIQQKLNTAHHQGIRTFLDGRSQELIPRLPLTPGFDLAYVDGAHDTPSELDDLRNVWPRTRTVMVVHDVYFPTVWTAFTCWVGMVDPKEIALVQLAAEFTGTAIVWRTR